MLSVNSVIVALCGYLQADKIAVDVVQKGVCLWAIPAAGAIVPGMGGAALLTSYRKLNRAKFAVLMQMEAELPIALFTREREIYRGRAPRLYRTEDALIASANPTAAPGVGRCRTSSA